MKHLSRKLCLFFVVMLLAASSVFALSANAAPSIGWDRPAQKKKNTYAVILGKREHSDLLRIQGTTGIKNLKVANGSIASAKVVRQDGGFFLKIDGLKKGNTKVSFKAAYKKKKKTVYKTLSFKLKVFNYMNPIRTLTIDFGDGPINLFANGKGNGEFYYKIPDKYKGKACTISYTPVAGEGGRSDGYFVSSGNMYTLENGRIKLAGCEAIADLDRSYKSEAELKSAFRGVESALEYTISAKQETEYQDDSDDPFAIFGQESGASNNSGPQEVNRYYGKFTNRIKPKAGDKVYFKYFMNPKTENRAMSEVFVYFQ